MKRNIEINFNSDEIDVLVNSLISVSCAPPPGTEKLLKRMQDITGEFTGAATATPEDIQMYEDTGKRSYRMRRYLNRRNYNASAQVDTRAAQWEAMFKGVEPR